VRTRSYVDGLQASTVVPGKISEAPLAVGGLTVADRVCLRLVEVTRQILLHFCFERKYKILRPAV
jgi:hypothetical protein